MNPTMWVSDWEPVTDVLSFHQHGTERHALVVTTEFGGIPATTACVPIRELNIEMLP